MDFSVEETVWIVLSDGTRLAAKVWLPEGPGPWPAVLEYLPYRRGDRTAPRDDSTYPHYARAGIAGVRVDSRGNGDSDGLMEDEYAPQELADACEVIAWIAAQGWSNGSVGMMGISWGGFNALQVAALRPPALKAVISIASTADRYNDDIHYKGGALLSANVYWAANMLSYSSRPPDPAVVGNGWAETWRERLAAQPMLLEIWLRHQHRDAYWKHGSICEDWGAIQCPVFVIAGWADGYRNTPEWIARDLEAPCWAMTGPWIHKYPHFAWPKPRADFIGLSVDWWHQWLSGEDRGVQDWPQHRAYRNEAVLPAPQRLHDPGCWVDASAAGGATRTLTLGQNGQLGAGEPADVVISTRQHCGTTGGEYFTTAPDAQMAGDQRADDGLSVCWETRALEAPLDLMGRPSVTAQVALDQAQGNLIARLCDVHPDGTSALISRGVLNLCHRGGNADPQPMVPGQAELVTITLDACCYRLRRGHRLRLALSTAYWPIVLPSPATVTAHLSNGTLHLPEHDLPEIDVPEPDDPSPLPAFPEITPGETQRRVEHDLQEGRVRYAVLEESGLEENPHNAMRFRDMRDESWEIAPDTPEGCKGRLFFVTERARGAWETRTEAVVNFTCRAATYDVEASLTAWIGEEEFHRKTWNFSVPRQLV